MLAIKVIFVPGGDWKHEEVLHHGTIANDATGTLMRGNYRASFAGKTYGSAEAVGVVKGFPRKSRTAWDLLFLALLDAVGGQFTREIRAKLLEWDGGSAICSNCAVIYVPKRRVTPSRQNYCTNCGRREAVRRASAAYRARKLGGLK